MTNMSNLSYFVLTLSILLNVILLAPSAFGQSQLTSDFGINVTSADDLTFTGFRNLPDNPPGETTITFAYVQEFPALAGQGVGGAFLKFGPNGINSLHNHPRGSEVLFVLSGSIVAGLVDTSNRLYTQTLQAGDAFLFPIGLTHFQINYNKEPATALAAFSNPNAGRTSLPPAIFNSNPRIDAGFLEDALALDANTVERLLNTAFPSVYGVSAGVSAR